MTLILLGIPRHSLAAIDFSGDVDYLNCGDTTILDGATSYTIGFVFDADSLAAEQHIASKYDDTLGPQSWMIDILTDGRILGCVIDADGDYTFHTSDAGKITTGGGVQYGMVVWGGGTTWAFYLNGVSAGDNNLGSNGTVNGLRNVSQALLIGARFNNTAVELPLNGALYQLDIWKNVALTSTQAADWYNAKLKSYGLTQGATLSFWLDNFPAGTSVNGLNFIDATGTLSCAGTDADSDSVIVGETTMNYPPSVGVMGQ